MKLKKEGAMFDITQSWLPKLHLAKDREQYCHAFELDSHLLESLSRRHIILLDTSVWIRLSDQRDEIASCVVDKLLRLKNAEKIFCPLAPSTIWEMRKQSDVSLFRTAELMENLSENVTFRSLEQLFDLEVDSFLHYLLTGKFKPLSLAQKFGPVMSYLAPGYRLDSSTSELPHINSLIHSSIRSIRLSTFVRMLGDKSSPSFPDRYDMASVSKRRRDHAGNSIDLARRFETEVIAKNIVIPLFNKKRLAMDIKDQLRIVSKLDALPKSRRYGSAIEHILRFTPAISASVEVFTISGLDVTRKNSQNDFFDRDLLIYAISYSGTFAAIDKWMASLVSLSKKGSYPAFYVFANSLEALDRQLDLIH